MKWVGIKPQLNLQGGHINSIFYNIPATGMLESTIFDVLFYNSRADLGSAERISIYLDNAGLVDVGGCTFDNSHMDCIVLDGARTLCSIRPNIFHKGLAAIRLNGSATNNVVSRGQVYNGVPVRVQDLGVSNQIPDGKVAGLLTSSFSVANDIFTSVQWSTAIQTNPYGWSDSKPARLTVGKVGRYRLTVVIRYQANATGNRRIKVLRNGEELSSSVSETGNAVDGAETVVSVYSRELALMTGDYIEVQIYQNSGRNLNVSSESFAELMFEDQA
ncbi:hypothetical protein G6M04_28740 [Agrobacterium rhizogenes]|uniref:hypothetical protein n=1 Tax=Rhizobium rhizogenes TaxID=359 RepID=UPI0015717E2B|nr:hypothetical protein [Rhizobium rhizogenes]NTG51394.1 hypothetical protein [Rhizobium rhizogenes]